MHKSGGQEMYESSAKGLSKHDIPTSATQVTTDIGGIFECFQWRFERAPCKISSGDGLQTGRDNY